MGYFFRNELPEYDATVLTSGIASIDLMDDAFHIPMKSWGMSVSATNINCVDNIFRSKNYSRLNTNLISVLG